MRLSIIIPVYNVENYVAQCLDSVLDQDLDSTDHEIIIVNDGSQDNSLQIIEGYAKKHDYIHIINKENGGMSSARNCGMERAVGKYIYFIDSDDFLLPNCLNTIVDTCERHDLNILTFLSQRFFSSSSDVYSVAKRKRNKASFGDGKLSEIVSGEDYLADLEFRNEVWWYVINREFMEGLGIKFEEGRYMEDVTFTLALFFKAERMAHLKLVAHRYRQSPGSIMTNRVPSHYNKLIRDMQNAACTFDPIIIAMENKTTNPNSIARVKTIQQSLVFFSMVRMLRSTMGFGEVKQRMKEMMAINAYPLDSLLGKDYNGITYQILVRLFKTESRFYFFFKLTNPVFKFGNKFLKQTL